MNFRLLIVDPTSDPPAAWGRYFEKNSDAKEMAVNYITDARHRDGLVLIYFVRDGKMQLHDKITYVDHAKVAVRR